jgi:hypothetical protein
MQNKQKLKDMKTPPPYIAYLKSLSSQPNRGNEQALFDCTIDSTLKNMHATFGKQVFEFSPILLGTLQQLSKDKRALVQSYLSNSKNSQDISISKILKTENPFNILNDASDNLIDSLVDELTDLKFSEQELKDGQKTSYIDKEELVAKISIIKSTIKQGTFDTLFNVLGKGFFLDASSSNIKRFSDLLIKGVDTKILTTLGSKFCTHLGYDGHHLPKLILDGNFDKVWNALGKEFFIKESYNMREGKSEVRAPNGFLSKVIEALELGIFDKMVEILGKNAFISGHIYSIPQIKKAIDNGNLDKIKKEFGDYFITDFNKSRNVEEISESMKLGTFDTMYKHLGYSFFGDTSHSYGGIKAISQTVLDKTFDEIIKSLGNKFFDSFGVSSINIVSQSIKKGNFAKIYRRLN